LAVAAAWMLWDGDSRKRILTPGPWVALAAFVAAAAPQALWLIDHDFQPFQYAARRASDGEWWAPIEFLLTLVVDHLPMFIVLACAGWFGKAAADAPPRPGQRTLRYLLLMGLGPALLTAAGAALSGASLRASWGAPMVVLSGLIAVALMSHKFSAARLKRTAIGAGVLIVLVSGLYFAHMRYGVALTGKPLRGNWPQAEISAQLADVWRRETNEAPLRIVAGDIWTAGLIGLHDRSPPSVLINGDYEAAPWVTPHEVARHGALVVWSGSRPSALSGFLGDLPQHELIFHPRAVADGRPQSAIRVYYAILPPGALETARAP
jgi:4-amino-4-deoxy-L-arabinose transferase-like glycosyltransferase